MHEPIDDCRLYLALRDMAWCGHEPETDAAAGELEIDLDVPRDLGLSEAATKTALEDLLEADLVHRVRTASDLEGSEHDDRRPAERIYVEPLDALTATTIIFCS